MKTELFASDEFTMRRVNFDGEEAWAIYSPEGYFSGLCSTKAQAEKVLATRNIGKGKS